jgi:hypothetical protein
MHNRFPKRGVLSVRIAAGICLAACAAPCGVALAGAAPGHDAWYVSTAEHSRFTQLQQSFTRGPEVTAACLACHTEAARQVQCSIHWTWEHGAAEQEELGKRNVINNY